MRHLLTVATVLLFLACCTTPGERTRMRAGLDSLNQRNRNDLPFTPADVQPFVDFFDRHGTANERLLAHYLMGRAYHEQGEAPIALQYYQQAVECADTTDRDCDYAQLSRVYGQMGDVFFDHNINDYQIQLYQNAVNYAMKAGDTITAMYNMEQICGVYERTDKLDSAIAVIETICQWYEEHGYKQDAAISYGRAATLLVNKENFSTAKKYFRIYERESGLFDQAGNIEKGREVYYYNKGLIYYHEQQYDSAEYYFRKDLLYGKDFNNQNAGAKGLAILFNKKHQADSATKYSMYAYAMNDSMYAQMVTEEVGQMQAMYDYTRNQEIAAQKTEEARKEKARRNIIVVIFVLFALFCTALLYRLYRRGKTGLERYKQSLIELQELRTEKQALNLHAVEYAKLISKKQQEIDNLEKSISKYGKLIYFNTANAERCLKGSATYQEIEHMAIKGQFLSEKEWVTIVNLIREYFPGFDDYITTYRHLLKDDEYRICLLLRLHFKAIDIVGMTGMSKSLISQRSTEIVRKLFQEKGSSKELSYKLAKIF